MVALVRRRGDGKPLSARRRIEDVGQSAGVSGRRLKRQRKRGEGERARRRRSLGVYKKCYKSWSREPCRIEGECRVYSVKNGCTSTGGGDLRKYLEEERKKEKEREREREEGVRERVRIFKKKKKIDPEIFSPLSKQSVERNIKSLGKGKKKTKKKNKKENKQGKKKVLSMRGILPLGMVKAGVL